MNWKHYTGLGVIIVLAFAGILSLLNQGVLWAGIPNRTTQNEQDIRTVKDEIKELRKNSEALPRIEFSLEVLSKQVSELQLDLKEHQKQSAGKP